MTQTNTAIILLAGQGTRLAPLTNKQHKALLPIGLGNSLQRQIEQLHRNGVANIHLALGYKAEEVSLAAQSLCANTPIKLHFHFNENFDATNNAFSLFRVLESAPQIDSFFLVDGDLVMSDSLVRMIAHDLETSFIVCDTDKTRLDEEAMKAVIQNKQVVRLNKACSISESFGEAIGFSFFRSDWTQAFRNNLESLMTDPLKRQKWYYEDVMEVLLQNKPQLNLTTKSTDAEPWIEVDDQTDYNRAMQIFG